MSVRTLAIKKDQVPNLSPEQQKWVFDLVKNKGLTPDQAFQKARELALNARNDQRVPKAKRRDVKKDQRAIKKATSMISLSSHGGSISSITGPVELQQKSHIFGVTTSGGRKSLQIDFLQRSINFIQGGQIHKAYTFRHLHNYDVDESISNELTLRFEDESYDINTDSTDQKYAIERLLSTILELNDLEKIGVNLYQNGITAAPVLKIIKQGELMKRGNTALPVWAKRAVKVETGSFSIYRPGDAKPLDVVRIWEGNATVKPRGSDGIVIKMRTDKENGRCFYFRVSSDGQLDGAAIKAERDDWFRAFKKACVTRRSTLRAKGQQISAAPSNEQNQQRTREVVKDGNFTPLIRPLGPNSTAGSTGYSTGGSSGSYSGSPEFERGGMRDSNHLYASAQDLQGSPADSFEQYSDDSDFDEDDVFPNSHAAPEYAHEQEAVLNILDIAISEGGNTLSRLRKNEEKISEVPEHVAPPRPCTGNYASRDPVYSRYIPQPEVESRDAEYCAPSEIPNHPSNGIVITYAKNDKGVSWTPSSNEVTPISSSAPPTAPSAPPAHPGAPPAPPGAPPLRAATVKNDCSNRTRLRQVYWRPIQPNRMENSIWQGSDDISRKLTLKSLDDLFSINVNSNLSPQKKAIQKTLVVGKRALTFGIFLKGLNIRGADIVEHLCKVSENESRMSVEQVATIRKFQPSVEDSETYNNYPGNKSELQEIDQFMMELCRIPELEKRLDLTLLLWEFPHQLNCLRPAIEQLTYACNKVKVSSKFSRILRYVLHIGNYLNSSTENGAVVTGFHLGSLNTLAETKGKDKKYSLLHYLIEQLKTVEPDLLDFPRELTDLSRCSEVSTKALEVEIEVLKNQLILIRKTAKSLRDGLKTPTPCESRFLEATDKFSKDQETLLQDLLTHYNKLHHQYHSVLTHLGQPQETASNELFTAISQFTEKFERVKNELQPRKASSESGSIQQNVRKGNPNRAPLPDPPKKKTMSNSN